ncbi:hypothetical protein A2866_00190 [Candidatus Roizmanbacteria bacterium RIFCSPHIGHO2_01_FULL_39_8]|uniref:Uncharacterized protein n=2 Tax=Candidatus Roizmaniibacteriota TaxID=1752723 RepID=A0A1F7GQC8_9BACT|nr:MAG: hypothetical protein A2866_00190 [Candidatus Roizmanbacteria bacterium RIFCSPHIGHO2_01_FULL_39_8]OGK25467.1 MAG: hypothetical protein A3C28_04015 [Candidatus Roizmanbacteria bacterium RIFCSPHIGHO2_02_FULL_39_9]
MKVTIQDIIAFLPFEEEYRQKIKRQLIEIDSATRISLEDQLWETFDALCDLYYQKNFQKGLYEMGEGAKSFGPNFYKRIREETDKEIEMDMTKKTTAFGIEEVREKLQKYIQEPK